MQEEIILAADIGGTNANLSIVRRTGKQFTIVYKDRKRTQEVVKFHDLINEFLAQANRAGYEPTKGCIAAAGAVVNQCVEMTNAHLIIDAKELEQTTPLSRVLVINDFEAVGHATNALDDDDVLVLHGVKPTKGSRSVVGAGTGLGTSYLYYDDVVDSFVPLPSEGGHSAMALQTAEELRLAEYIKRRSGAPYLIWEHVLSGKGIVHLYGFLHKTKYKTAPVLHNPRDISHSQKDNPCAAQTMQWFVQFYARYARSCALQVLSHGGLFIAGGIAAKNIPVFEKYFMKEFRANPYYEKLLASFPVYLVKDYNVSLRGAAHALYYDELHYVCKKSVYDAAKKT